LDWISRCRLEAVAKEVRKGETVEEMHIQFQGRGNLWAADVTFPVHRSKEWTKQRRVKLRSSNYAAVLLRKDAESPLTVSQLGTGESGKGPPDVSVLTQGFLVLAGGVPDTTPATIAQAIRELTQLGWAIKAEDTERHGIKCCGVRLTKVQPGKPTRFIQYFLRRDFHLALLEELIGQVRDGKDQVESIISLELMDFQKSKPRAARWKDEMLRAQVVRTSEIKILEDPCTLGESAFTLAAYGLPEPGSVAIKDQGSLGRLMLGLGAATLIGAGVWAIWRSRLQRA
jgi:hypothetical protein